MKKKVPQSVGDCFELIEREMLAGPWVMGDRYTISDPYLFTLAQWLEGDGVDPARFPKVAEHRARMAEDPVVKRVIAAELSDCCPLSAARRSDCRYGWIAAASQRVQPAPTAPLVSVAPVKPNR